MKTKIMTLSFLMASFISVAAYADGGTDQATYKAAVQTCASKLSLTTPIQWKGLDQSTRADLRSCLVAEGVKPHRHHRKFWKAVQACVAQDGVNLPAFQPGVKPTLTAAQQSAVQSCKATVKAQFKAQHAANSTASNSSTN